ncbi:MAG: cytochrome b/b6 domain-containing protein [Sphingomonadales bacterium]
MANGTGKTYKVWSKPTRVFHWVNVVCVFALIVVGLIIFNGGQFKFGPEARIMLKTVHVMIGYVFVANLFIRLIFGLIGDKHTHFSAISPFKKNFFKDLKDFSAAYNTSKPIEYLGHNPLGRISISILFILLISQAVTGIVLAGTDIFFPPFGAYFAEMVAASGVNPADVVPYNADLVDAERVKEMRAIRAPFIKLHIYGLYGISTMVVLHIATIINHEIKHNDGLVSSMISGKRTLKGEPKDKG